MADPELTSGPLWWAPVASVAIFVVSRAFRSLICAPLSGLRFAYATPDLATKLRVEMPGQLSGLLAAALALDEPHNLSTAGCVRRWPRQAC